MFPKTIAVKKTALANLQNQWPAAIAEASLVLAFYLVLINLFSFSREIFSGTLANIVMTALFMAVVIFIGLPLIMGMLRNFWGMATETPLKITEMFYYFSSKEVYKKITVFTFLILGRLVLRSVALLLPSIIIGLISRYSFLFFANSAEPLWFSNIWIFELVLRAIAICGIIYMSLRYYLAPFIFIANEDIDEMVCVQKAYMVSKLCLSNFSALFISLLGWVLLSVFFVPLVFTLPYILMCYIVHARYAVVYYNNRVKSYNSNALEVIL